MLNILWIIIAYIIGSIPWGLIIGKVFFKKDIRNYGSGNLGGTNAGRVLGFPIGILVIVLDASKAFITMALAINYVPEIIEYIGLAVCFGHCFPIFANFKGGKAVACSCGYVLALAIYVTHEYLLTFIIPMLIFLVIVISTRYVSLGSMIAALSSSITQLILGNINLFIILLLLASFIIYRHKANVQRLIKGNESKLKIKELLNKRWKKVE